MNVLQFLLRSLNARSILVLELSDRISQISVLLLKENAR